MINYIVNHSHTHTHTRWIGFLFGSLCLSVYFYISVSSFASIATIFAAIFIALVILSCSFSYIYIWEYIKTRSVSVCIPLPHAWWWWLSKLDKKRHRTTETKNGPIPRINYSSFYLTVGGWRRQRRLTKTFPMYLCQWCLSPEIMSIHWFILLTCIINSFLVCM